MAVRENRLKLTPPSMTVSPIGYAGRCLGGGTGRGTTSICWRPSRRLLPSAAGPACRDEVAFDYSDSLPQAGDLIPDADNRLISALMFEERARPRSRAGSRRNSQPSAVGRAIELRSS